MEPAVREPSYREGIEWLLSLSPAGIRLGLERMREALRLAGDPHLAVPVVHIAGTNGKGSTACLVAETLRRSGLKVGLYTSPHLHRFGERIRIDGEPMSEAKLASAIASLRALLAQEGAPRLTFFEAATFLAFEAFSEAGCDLVVLEVGLGGRLDATNVVPSPLATAITSIGLDHQSYLGDTLASIAREKAGVIKAGTPVFVGALPEEAAEVIEGIAEERGAPIIRLGTDLFVVDEEKTGIIRISFGQRSLSGLRLGLLGAHQRNNAALAAGILIQLSSAGIGVREEALREAFREARWPGRLERIPGEGEADLLLDGAHNREGAEALVAFLRSQPPRRRVLLFAAMQDKPWPALLELLGPEVEAVITTELPMERSARARELAEELAERPEVVAEADPKEALALAMERAGPDGEVLVAGSLYLVAAARAARLGLEEELLIGM